MTDLSAEQLKLLFELVLVAALDAIENPSGLMGWQTVKWLEQREHENVQTNLDFLIQSEHVKAQMFGDLMMYRIKMRGINRLRQLDIVDDPRE